jgi:phenylacetate-CoA ligase
MVATEPRMPATGSLPQIGDWQSFDELRELQDRQLPLVLERARRAPSYEGRFDGVTLSGHGLGPLPLTTKEDLYEAYPRGLCAASGARVASYFESSGSEGRPIAAFYTETDWQDLAERYARKSCGIDPDDVFLVRTPYALGLAGHLAQRAGHLRGATVVPGDNRTSVMPFARVVRVLHDLGVTLTWSNPTDCLMWAAAARHAGLDPRHDFPALRAIFVGGEPLTPARRRRIADIWGVPVIDEYGCTEVGSLAGRCPHDQLHLWADRVLPEVRDPATGELGAEGRGELVVTPLYLEAMPLVRYNLRDLVEVTQRPCPCGWQLPVIDVLGRGAQGFPVAGTTVTQAQVESIVFSLPFELGILFWRARAEADALHLQIEVDDDRAADAREAVTDGVERTLGVPLALDLLSPGGLVPTEVLASPRHSQKPRSLYGPGESWTDALLFGGR